MGFYLVERYVPVELALAVTIRTARPMSTPPVSWSSRRRMTGRPSMPAALATADAYRVSQAALMRACAAPSSSACASTGFPGWMNWGSSVT
jgi:hypothetical protein